MVGGGIGELREWRIWVMGEGARARGQHRAPIMSSYILVHGSVLGCVLGIGTGVVASPLQNGGERKIKGTRLKLHASEAGQDIT